MKYTFQYVWTCLFACLFIPGYAQFDNIRFERISEKHGLPHGKVEDILEDSYGYLWFATQEGVFRYNGYDFKPYRHDILDSTTLSHPFARCIFEDSHHIIWVGTTYGLNQLDQVNGKFHRFMPVPEAGRKSKVRNIVHAIGEDSKGNLWVGTNSGLHLFNRSSGTFKYVKPPEASSPGVYNFFNASDGNLWAAGAFGLVRINAADTTMTTYKIHLNIDDKVNYAAGGILELSPDRFLVNTSAGLLTFNPASGKITQVFTNDPDLNQRINETVVDKKGRVWAGIWGEGLLAFHPDNKNDYELFRHHPDIPNSIINHKIKCLLSDQFDNIWVGTSNGLCKVKTTGSGFRLIKNNYGSDHNSNRVQRIFKDSRQTIWTMTSDGFYAIRPGEEFGEKVEIYPSLPEDIIVSSIVEDAQKNIWISLLDHGIFYKTPEADGFRPIPPGDTLNKVRIYKMEADLKENGIIWLGTSAGLCRLDMSTNNRKWYIPKLQVPEIPNNKVAVFTHSPDNKIWLYYTYYNHLGSFDKQTGVFRIFKPSGVNRSALEGDISDIEAGEDDRIWFATLYGLTSFNTKTHHFRIYTKSDGLAENELTIVQKDERGNLWICGNRNISFFDLEKGSIINHTTDGEIKNFLNKSKCLDNNGQVYLGGLNGFFTFHPDELGANQQIPDIVLEKFKVWNEPYDLGKRPEDVKKIVLPYNENDITFEFAALHYINPEGNTYRCKLEGYDKDWQQIGKERKANYTNLNHGEYTFLVSASNSDGYWNDQGLSVDLVITPAIWETSWFRALVFLVLMSIAYAVIRNWQQKARLKRQKLLAEQTAEYKTRFLANVSHEIRNPMNSIIGLSDLTLETGLDEKQRKFLTVIKKSSSNLLKIINDLLDFSKLESGQFTFTRSNFDLAEVIFGVKDLLISKAEAKGLELSVEIDKSIPLKLSGDPIRLNQILINLTGNAIKFTESGKVWLKVTLIHVSATEAELQFEVGDTGIGIPEEKLEMIFDDFSQADENTFTKYGGTGLGLSISKQLVEKQGGQLNIESVVGKGTRLWFSLGYGIAKPDPLKAETASMVPEFGPMSVLIVEDNEFNQLLALEFLKLYLPEGQFDIVANGREALEKISEKTFDVILMDIKMPVMNGFEATKAIRQLKDDRQNTPIIGLTANASPDQIEMCITAGMNDVVTKPFDKDELLLKLHKFSKIPQK